MNVSIDSYDCFDTNLFYDNQLPITYRIADKFGEILTLARFKGDLNAYCHRHVCI